MGLMVAEPVILLFEGMHGAPDQFQLFLLPTMPTWLHSGQGATWTQRHQILGQ
jgi:hypothetical protein